LKREIQLKGPEYWIQAQPGPMGPRERNPGQLQAFPEVVNMTLGIVIRAGHLVRVILGDRTLGFGTLPKSDFYEKSMKMIIFEQGKSR